MVYYLARRHLSMAPGEWDGLAWWEQQMYLDGMEHEGLVEWRQPSADPTVVSERTHHEGSNTVTDREHRATFSGQPGEMSAFGIKEQALPR